MITNLFFKLISNITNKVLETFDIKIIFRIGNSKGDQLCMTFAARYIKNSKNTKIIVVSSNPIFFLNNKNIWKNYSAKFNPILINRLLRKISGKRILHFFFTSELDSYESYMKKNKLHLIEAHSLHFLPIDRNLIKNEIFFSKEELRIFQLKFLGFKNFALIQPNAKSTYTANKQWALSNFQAVVDNIKEINWIQVGIRNDNLLKNVTDFRGKTDDRELFYLVKKSRFVFSNEGYLNHIASAFDKTSFVIQSGFSDKSIATYQNTFFFTSEKCPKAPCWILNDCNIPNKPCLSGINPHTVVKTIKNEIHIHN